jgi:hypothetical protein
VDLQANPLTLAIAQGETMDRIATFHFASSFICTLSDFAANWFIHSYTLPSVLLFPYNRHPSLFGSYVTPVAESVKKGVKSVADLNFASTH